MESNVEYDLWKICFEKAGCLDEHFKKIHQKLAERGYWSDFEEELAGATTVARVRWGICLDGQHVEYNLRQYRLF